MPKCQQRLRVPTLFLLSILISQIAHAENPTLEKFTACTIGGDTAALPAQCATATVPLSYQPGDSRTLELFVSKIPARQTSAHANPLVLLAGGPGQAASSSFPALMHAFADVNEQRDLILIDQRGTGNSNRLDCETSAPSEQLEFDPEVVRKLSQNCLDAQTIDTRYFTTSIAVKDLETVRELLNIDQWNLYGVSYGTRVALHYMRRYPDAVRSVVLDAVVPPQVSLSADIAIHAQQALDKLYDYCSETLDCAEAFPDLKMRTEELLTDLQTEPVSVDYEDVSTGTIQNLELTNKHLAITLRLMTYSSYGVAILPSMLFDAYENGNYAPLARQAVMQTQSLGSTIATGLHNAIICTEDLPSGVSESQRLAARDSYLGDELIESLEANCEPWPLGVMDEDFKQPLVADTPTLILSGAADPITPAIYGEQVAESLTNQLHIINNHQGHMQLPLGCIPKLMALFLETADVAQINTQCLDRLSAPAFFIDANGPRP